MKGDLYGFHRLLPASTHMNWFHNIFHKERENPGKLLSDIQEKFFIFLNILEKNNQILKTIGDMEEKLQGDYLFDINYIISSLSKIRSGVKDIIDQLITIGGQRYSPLEKQLQAINNDIDCMIPVNKAVVKDDFTIPIEELSGKRSVSVGSKIAQLGELKSKLGLAVPEGFAISAWSYKHFVDANSLQEKINKSINKLDIKHYNDLVRISNEIQGMIKSNPVPDDLVSAIQKRYKELKERSHAKGVSLRSSAIGEDTSLSFAGQYATFLNVRDNELIDKYREVLASKFTPKAIYYFLSHALSESELAMGVGCMAMVDASVSGVMYTLDPVHPEKECLVLNSIYGLGKYLVDGTIMPDVFKISKKDMTVKESLTAVKPVRLVMGSNGGTVEEPVPASEQNMPSLNDEQIKLLTDIAMRIENHYGCPQDIEWAIDQSRRLFLLQTRPLRVIKARPPVLSPDTSKLEALLSNGITVCPGAGAGRVFHAHSIQDLSNIPDGTVLVANNPFPGLITAMGRVNAIVTESGGIASHMATLAREYRVPTLCGARGAMGIASGKPVTVDATGGIIYEGIHRDLIDARRPDYEFFDQTAIFELLKNILTKISPLSMIDSTAPSFQPENCRTFHDITRFVHQKAMEEMFTTATDVGFREEIGLRLKSDIPLAMNVIYIDRTVSGSIREKSLPDNEIDSVPMNAFWSGVKEEGWPSAPPVNLMGMVSVLSTQMLRGERYGFLEKSFAILGKEYMLLGLYMGYHLSTIEAMCSDDLDKNYIRMQYKEGGASLDRRIRRISLLKDILSCMGFENFSESDFLDSMLYHTDRQSIIEKLHLLGRISMMFKQLDMALSNDSVTRWYRDDFVKRLNLSKNNSG